jgi:hypothetical protein
MFMYAASLVIVELSNKQKHHEQQICCPPHLMVPWFSTPKLRPSLGELLSNSHAADTAAVQEGLALCRECACVQNSPNTPLNQMQTIRTSTT